jgi:hypothetical protein
MSIFSFTPRTDVEIHEFQNKKLLPEGIYPFIVKEIEPGVSEAGNPMLIVRLGIMDNNGEERNIMDYLLATDGWIYKLKHFCESIGFEREYNEGKLDPLKAIHRSGLVKLVIKKGDMKSDGTFFKDSNSVKDYLKGDPSVQKKPVEIAPSLNDDIAF